MRIKTILISLAFVMLCAGMSGCGVERGENERTDSREEEVTMEPIITTSTDVSVVKKLFPSLEGAETIDMEQLKYGGSEEADKLPTPVDYKYRGYITLSEDAAEKYAKSYSFSKTQAQVSFESVSEREGDWQYSFDFCKEILPAGLVGYVWMDDNTLLFDIGTM